MSEERRKKKPMIVRPGVDRNAGFGGQYSPVETYSKPKGEESAGGTTATPDSSQTGEAPSPKAQAERLSPSTNARSAPDRPKPPVKKLPEKPSKPVTKPKDAKGETVQVSLTVYPKLAHSERLDAMAAKGVAIMDIIKVAGRRATAAFEPNSTFVEAPDVQRMSADYRYTTSKKIGSKLLEQLHVAQNPLRLKSDNTMLRGQFEPLFWSMLDQVIKELEGTKGE